MSARQAARWKRAACPALARDSFSKSKIWRRNQGFGSHLGGLRVPVAQSSRWALAAPSARFAPSGASEPPKGVVPPQKWWPSVVAGTSRSSSVTAPPASKCGCGVCPAPQARAKRAPRATRATPAQAFRAPLRRKKRGLPLQQARRAIAPFALPPRQALPRLPLKRRARHTAPRAYQRAFASLYTPSHHRIGNWITAAMAAVYSTHTSARPKCPPSRATPLKYT